MELIKKIIGWIDQISEVSGKIACWIIIPLVLGTMYDVFMRYFFKMPTKWAYELTWMEYGALFMLGGAYNLKNRLHVRVDVIYNQYPERVRAAFDALMYLVFFFPLYSILIIYGSKYAAYSWKINEHSYLSYWQPAVYPIKTVIPIAFLLFILQGFSEFIKSSYRAIKGEPL